MKKGKTRALSALIIVVVFFCSLSGCFSGGSSTNAEVTQKLELAIKYLSESKFEQAILAYNEVIQIDAKNVTAYRGLSLAYVLQEDYIQAEQVLKDGIEATQGDLGIRLSLASFHLDMGDKDKAKGIYENLIADEENVDFRVRSAYVHYLINEQQSQEAVTYLEEIIENESDNYQIYSLLSWAYLQNGNETKAENAAVRSISLDNNQRESFDILKDVFGRYLFEMISLGEQLIDEDRIIEGELIKLYAQYHSFSYSEVVTNYQQQVSDKTRTTLLARLLAAGGYVGIGETDNALQILKDIDYKDIDNAGLLSLLAEVYFNLQDYETARQIALQGIVTDETYMENYIILNRISKNIKEDDNIWSLKLRLNNIYGPKELEKITEVYTWKKGMEKYAEASAVEGTPDGGAIFVGSTSLIYNPGEKCEMYACKYTADGTIQWSSTYPGNGSTWGYDIKKLSDNSYILIGADTVLNTSYLVNVDSFGNMRWENYLDIGVSNIMPDKEGGVKVFGYKRSDNPEVLTIYNAELDVEGNVISTISKSIEGMYFERISSILPAVDGGYLICGNTKSIGASGTNSYGSPTGNYYVVKVDNDGNIEWDRVYGSSTDENIWASLVSQDGEYVITGQIGNYPTTCWCMKINAKGEPLWEWKTDDIRINGILDLDDGYLLFGEYASPYLPGSGLLIKMSSNGEKEWMNECFGFKFSNEIADVAEACDSGFIAAGTTWEEPGCCKALFLKTDEQGDIKESLVIYR